MFPYFKRKSLFIAVIIAVLAAAAFVTDVVLKQTSARPSSVVLIIVDTLGAKHIGFLNNSVNPTPAIDRMALEGFAFSRAYSPCSWTKPSITSVLTSRLPSSHGVEAVGSVIPQSIPTLAERLKENGFRTAAFVSHTMLRGKHGFGRGFESYRIIRKGPVNDAISSGMVTAAAVKWLDGLTAEGREPQRFFLMLHYFDPHFNYKHHPDFDMTKGYDGPLKDIKSVSQLRTMIPQMQPADVQYMVNLYREEIAYTDFHIGRLLEHIKKLNLEKDVLVVFTADHGEEFLERDWIGHGRHLYDELIHVPLIFRHSSIRGGKLCDTPVSTLDVAPTILDFLDLSEGWKTDGQSLARVLETGSNPEGGRDIISELDFESREERRNSHKTSVIRSQWKLIHDRDDGAFELYNLIDDPSERSNLIDKAAPAELEIMRESIKRVEKARVETSPRERTDLDPKEVERLRSLGYL